jgi:hypothetical protein
VKVLQHQNRGSILRGQSIDAADRGQWILASAVASGLLASSGQARLDIPGGQPPGRILVLAELADFGQSVGVFVGFNPDRREAGLHKLGKPID